jgi:hypothetical protein
MTTCLFNLSNNPLSRNTGGQKLTMTQDNQLHMGLTITTTVKNDHVTNQARELIAQELTKHNGHVLKIEIKRNTQKTLKQYGYLFGVVYKIIRQAIKETDGQNIADDELDLMMKLKFWHTTIIDPETQEIIRVPNLKRKMNRAELAVFIEDVMNWGTACFNIEKYPSADDFKDDEFYHIDEMTTY